MYSGAKAFCNHPADVVRGSTRGLRRVDAGGIEPRSGLMLACSTLFPISELLGAETSEACGRSEKTCRHCRGFGVVVPRLRGPSSLKEAPPKGSTPNRRHHVRWPTMNPC